jgi:hypothetical protein
MRWRLERERLWLRAWWRWCRGDRGCLLGDLTRRRQWQTLDWLALDSDS